MPCLGKIPGSVEQPNIILIICKIKNTDETTIKYVIWKLSWAIINIISNNIYGIAIAPNPINKGQWYLPVTQQELQ